ncbi:hypothetical protein EC957_010788 [Mortierella hygrophila]|uniref:DNA (cytosine-5-)-methyltransferase n=1 Tax=Mortierella hygrophila TaxID=979708 RepID=A0A9P6K7T5_9FUNG|nr:hypothetical protein EC957_010788 [Mortierella hygrophila]
MSMPTTLEGYYGEGYEQAERMSRQREPNNYKDETESVEWLDRALGERVDEVTGRTRVFYEAAMIDGETIKVGEYVFIREGFEDDSKAEDENTMSSDMRIGDDGVLRRLRRNVRRKRGDRGLYREDDDGDTLEGSDSGFGGKLEAKGTWFGQVMYFYEEEEDDLKHMRAHVRYFSPGQQTILMEQSSWQELFLLDNCDWVDLESVMGKFRLRRITSTAQLKEEDTYFYRYLYDPKFCAFEDAAKCETGEAQDPPQPCICCDLKQRKAINDEDNPYHLHDFVYLVDSGSEEYKPLGIGQITKLHLDSSSCYKDAIRKATVRLLLRHDDFLDKNPPMSERHKRLQQYIFKDCRRLVLTDVEKEVPLEDLEATCRVCFVPEVKETKERSGAFQRRPCAEEQESNSYKDQQDSFWFMDYYFVPAQDSGKVDMRKSTLRASRERLYRIYDEKGNSDGLHTLVKMPQDCLACKRRWIQEDAKRKRLCKAGPKLRAMDIFAGCGGMSLGLKQSGIVETKYSVELDQDAAATFSYNFPSVAVRNHDAGLLLKQAIFQSREGGEGQTTRLGKNRMASLSPTMPPPDEVDFIYCGPPCQGFTYATGRSNRDDPKNSLVATAMAYVDFYRPRYLLLENVKGFTEIGDKAAVHKKTFVKFVMRCLTELGYQCRIAMLQAGHFGVPQSRYRFFYNDHKAFHYFGRRRYQAPDPMVTVRDALSDLPGFEYIHPDDVDKETGSVKINRTGSFVRINSLEKGSNRIGSKEWVSETDRRLCGEDRAQLRKITKYRTGPQCEYQRKLRCQVSENDRIRNHITELLRPATVKSIYKFDMAPKARLGGKGSRLDFDGFFNTVTSSADPMNSPGIIHPNQHRVTTIRERARAQGFPDTFIFPADQSPLRWRKQIGNAVPPPLAEALGGMLVEAIIQDKEHEEGGRRRP